MRKVLFLQANKFLPSFTYTIMKKASLIILSLILFTPWVNGNERIVISRWLQAGPLDAPYPAFHQVPNTQGKTFAHSELLSFNHLDLKDYFPVSGMSLPWLWGQNGSWSPVASDENGYVMISGNISGQHPRVAYLATYVRTDRWLETKLEIKSPYLLEVWLDGKRIASKNTQETEENTIGRINRELKLTRGTHLLVIKTLLPPAGNLDWKVMANLSISEPYKLADLSPDLNPDNIKNINHILDGVKISGIEPSADGKYYLVRYTQSLPPTDQSESWAEVKRMSDRQTIQSFRHSRLSRISWLPRSNVLSYVSNTNGKSAIHWHHIETGQHRILMDDIDKFAGLQWSPCETYFIYTLREDGQGTDGNLRQILGMRDRQPGWRNRSFLYKYDLATGIRTRLTYGNNSTDLQDISPDGSKILIGLNYADYTQRPYSKSDLFLMDVKTLRVDTLFLAQPWGFSASFSPDGKKLLATGGPSSFNGAGINLPQDLIPNNYDRQAYIYDLATGETHCITRDFNPSIASSHWHAPDNSIYFLTNDQDCQRIYRYDLRRATFSLVNTGMDYIASMNITASASRMIFRGNHPNKPSAFYQMDLKNQRISLLEDSESKIYQHVSFGEVKDWNFKASSGVEIKGRYYLPANFDPDRKYPVIVYYYGGTNPVGRTFGGRYPFNLWAGNGYVVYVLQPSGATGFGQQFSAAHVNNWGITVADEIIEGTRQFLQAHPFTDATKVGCAGASYGGFMTMLLMTRTDLFAAAISHAGISSISSYWGEGFWGYSYSAEATAESFPWCSPNIYVGQSPLFHADKVTTPLLLITGDSDTNVPPGESIQMYTALKILNRPVELVMVKGEDHHIVTYNKRIEWHNTIMAWWDRYLKDQPQMWEDLFPQQNY